jgi:type II secretory pathway pseudopilin PulG
MRAFTLIETLVAITVFTLAMAGAMGFIVMAWRTHSYTWEQSIAIQEARRAIEMFTKEIRETRQGDDGSFPLARTDDKEIIFYADIDKDEATERVRYSFGSSGAVTSHVSTQKCVTFSDGGLCSVIFSDFFSATLKSAQLTVSLEGDLAWKNEYVEIFADGVKLDELCKSGCNDCAGNWQGAKTFNVKEQGLDNYLEVSADASLWVNAICDWQEPHHSMKAKFELNWEEEAVAPLPEFEKGVIEPTEPPIQYPVAQEQVWSLSSYLRNPSYVFKYFDEQGQEISAAEERQQNTKVITVYLLIDVNPARSPLPFELETDVQLRNLKENQ